MNQLRVHCVAAAQPTPHDHPAPFPRIGDNRYAVDPLPVLTATPSASPAPVFVLLDQKSVCDATQPAGLLQIVVQDSKGEPVPGVQVTIAWDGGLDTFYTGLKPELGAGYADFQMTPGIVYSLRAGNSATINNLSAPECSDTDGNPYTGGWHLLFGQ